MRKAFLLILLGVAMSTSSMAQSDTLRQWSIQFFEKLMDHQSSSALNILYQNSPEILNDTASWNEMVYQLDQLEMNYGPIMGYELIKERALGQNFVLITYMGRYQYEPVRFTLEFYRPGQTWEIYGFSFDLNLVRDLEDASRDY